MTRSLIRHTPFQRPFVGAFEPLFSKSMLDEFFAPVMNRVAPNGDNDGAAHMGWWPAADVLQNDEAYTLAVDLPGLTKGDIDLTIENQTLTLSGERQAGHDAQTADRVERVYGRFARRFNLPNDVDVSAVSAEFENGVLNIVIPKAEGAKAKKIDIA